MTTVRPLVALIHATPAAMEPAGAAFAERFPAAILWNLLDDRLITDAEGAGGVVPRLRRRMAGLIAHAIEGGADAVLLTCSQYGPGAELAATLYDVPVHGSDDAMLDWVVEAVPRAVAVLGSLESSVADSTRRLDRLLVETYGANPTRVVGVMCPGAAPAAAAGDNEALLASMLAAAEPYRGAVNAFLLAQYSLTPVAAQLAERLAAPVLSPPHLAAEALRRRLERTSPDDEPAMHTAAG